MAANTTPIFTISPHIGQVRISTANTGRDGSGTLNDLVVGTINGSRIDRITINATGTTTAGAVRFFLWDGTNNRFWKEVLVQAITASGTTQVFTTTILSPDPMSPLLVLPTGWTLRCAPNNAETFDVIAHSGDF